MTASLCVFLVLGIVYSVPYVNNGIPDMHFEMLEQFGIYNIPSDTFVSDDETGITLKVTPNPYVSSTFSESYVVASFMYIRLEHIVEDSGFLYLLSREMLIVMEINNDQVTEPVFLGIFDLKSFTSLDGVKCLVVDEDIAYISTYSSLLILDVSDKTDISLAGTFTSDDSEINDSLDLMYIQNDRLVTINSYMGVVLFDISDRKNPILLGSDMTIYTCYNYRCAQVDENAEYLYLVNNYDEKFCIYDIRSGTNFELVGSVQLERPYGLALLGSEKAIVVGSNDMFVVDYSDTEDITSINFDYEYEGYSVNLGRTEEYAYIADYWEFKVVNINNLEEPFVEGILEIRDCERDLFYYGDDYVFLLCDNSVIDGYAVIDVSDPTNPFVAYSPLDDHFFAHPSHPNTVVGFGGMNYYGQDPKTLIVDDDYNIYFVDGYSLRIFRFDESQGSISLIKKYMIDVEDNVWIRDISPHGDYLFAIVDGWDKSFAILDVSDPVNPSIVYETYYDEIEYCNSCRILAFENYVYISEAEEDNFIIINVESVTSPFIESVTTSTPVGVFAVDENQNFAYFVDLEYLSILNISNVSHPFEVSQIPIETDAYDWYKIGIEVRDEYVYFANGKAGLEIYDVSDKTNPVLVGEGNTVDALNVYLKDELAYISDNYAGVVVMNISDPSSPTTLGRSDSIHTFDALLVVVSKNHVFVSGGNEGFQVVQFVFSLVGTYEFAFFCGEAEITLIAEDSTGSCEDSFTITRDDYCNGRGSCLQDYECSCSDGYSGLSCESWSCGYDFTDVTNVCSGHGDCVGPDSCECRAGYVGDRCETNTMYYSVLIPTLSSAIIFVLVSVVLCILCCCCCYCVVFCCVFMCFCCSACTLFRKASKQKTGLKKFSKLKNFDLYLKEQEMEENVSIAHLRINKDLFRIEFNEIDIKEVLGEGGSNSTVYRALWNGKDVGFKCFRTRTVCDNQDKFNEFEREVQILGSVSHPNILQFYGCCLHPPRVGILMEFCENGDLYVFLVNYLKKNGESYKFAEKLRMCHEIILPMRYLHARNVIHRDLKLENVLVDKVFSCQLMDFGLSRIVDRLSKAKTKSVGTSSFMAPEILTGKYDEKVDVYAFSICCFIILTEMYKPYEQLDETANIEFQVASNPNLRPPLSRLRKSVPKDHVQWLTRALTQGWDHEASLRPDFAELSEMFAKALELVKGGKTSENRKSDILVLEDVPFNQGSQSSDGSGTRFSSSTATRQNISTGGSSDKITINQSYETSNADELNEVYLELVEKNKEYRRIYDMNVRTRDEIRKEVEDFEKRRLLSQNESM